MPCIVTTLHDPVALAATCQRFNVPPPEQGCLHLDDQEASGWIVRLPGARFPIVCATLTGLIAYHPADNALERYARLMPFYLSLLRRADLAASALSLRAWRATASLAAAPPAGPAAPRIGRFAMRLP